MKKVILTNMCMVYKEDGSILVQLRTKSDWPGLTFPGGHVEENESLVDSVVREVKEETGLIISNVEEVEPIIWDIDGVIHECHLFRTKDFEGKLLSSNEGEVFFIHISNINKYQFSTDFDKVLEKTLRGIIWNS